MYLFNAYFSFSTLQCLLLLLPHKCPILSPIELKVLIIPCRIMTTDPAVKLRQNDVYYAKVYTAKHRI